MPSIDQMVNRQINRWDSERAAFHKRRQEEAGTLPERPAELKPIVTISRQRGCRGVELAKFLSHELQYGLFDRQIIEYVARHASVRRDVVESLDERGRSDLELWVEGLLSRRITDRGDYFQALGEVVKTTALQGGVVIVGRGANYMLSGTSAYRIRLVAPIEWRVRSLTESQDMSEKRARDEIKKADRERAQFVKGYFHKDIDDPTDYDMVLNLGTHSLESAGKIILSALRAKGWAMELTGGDKRAKRRK